ncbi:hypothetical protein [Candidatus Uabimicrobium sp. HlEnr_7]|uniref:hypothetical protein n=1 Tax=Candidatus Uabimicrobium helgolandensis TaxID=3095367 RepID=UPI0035562E51
MSDTGETTKRKVKNWADLLKQVDVQGKQNIQDPLVEHLQKIEAAEQKVLQESQRKRERLKEYLKQLKAKQEEEKAYNHLNLLEKRLYKALIAWYKDQTETIPDGILEFHFKSRVLQKIDFEKIDGDFDSTLKIKKLNASSKLKEMLLVFKRGKNIFLEFYNRDLRNNIFTFMFMEGKVISNQKSPEVSNVIGHFKEFILAKRTK